MLLWNVMSHGERKITRGFSFEENKLSNWPQDTKWKTDGEMYINWDFICFILHKVWLGCSDEEELRQVKHRAGMVVTGRPNNLSQDKAQWQTHVDT
jgi:hypothetical protein